MVVIGPLLLLLIILLLGIPKKIADFEISIIKSIVTKIKIF